MTDSAAGPPRAVATGNGLLQAVPFGVLVMIGSDGVIASATEVALRLLGWPDNEVTGSDAHAMLHGSAARCEDAPGCQLRTALRSGACDHRVNDVFVRGDGQLLPVSWWIRPVTSGGDAPGAVVLSFLDATDQRAQAVTDSAERAKDQASLWSAQQSIDHLGWIAELTRTLSSTLDEVEALRLLAGLLTPRLCEVAIVDVIDDAGLMTRVGASLAPGISDIDLDAILADPAIAHVPGADQVTRATITAHAVRHLSSTGLADPAVLDAPSRLLLAEVGARSALVIPLGTRDAIVGVAAAIRRDDTPFSDAELLLAADVGRRAGLVLDNARLYKRQQAIATNLQMALLPTITDAEHVHAAARYLPARDLHQVGGDWYDLFVCPATNALVMIIGDAAGHNLAAAATMAAVRNLLRGAAVAAGAGPAATLDTVDRALRPLGLAGTSSAVVLAATRQDNQWTITWANAGHLPPLLINADGHTVTELAAKPQPLLGTGVEIERVNQTMTIPFGSTVLMYTDGLVERRDEPLDAGILRLHYAVTDSAGGHPSELLDGITRRMPASPEDDTAMLAVTLN